MNPRFKKWLKISAAVHVVLLFILIVGMPVFTKDEPISPRIIPVDIVTIAEMTNTRIAPEKPEPPAPVPQKVEAPKPPPPPPEPPEEQKVEKLEPPAPDPQAEALPDKTKPPEKKEEKKKEEKKPEEKPKPKKDLLASVLKNVEKMKEEVPPTPDAPPAEVADQPVVSHDAPALAQQLSISEMDALRRQIQQCWNVPIGARGVETMTVEVIIDVNPDKTVRAAEVADRVRMATDPFFRTVAESARRALYNPRCTPLILPDGKYDQWNRIRMNFNPAEMF